MPDQSVDIRIRTRGARQAAAEAKLVGREIDQIGGRARRAAGGMRLFTRATTTAGHGMRLTAGAALYGGAAIAGGLVIELKRATTAWQESRKVTADTGAALRSTGGSAHVTAQHIGALANAIKRKAGIDDEAVQSGENVLLTFLRVRNEVGRGNNVFDRATQSAVDMSARFKKDLTGSFVQVGKALDDPIKGVTALRRTGVTFTKGQIEQIKTLEETGQHLRAQRLVLAALDKQVKGSAAAQATPLDRLKTSWGDLEEAIGHGMQPVTDRFFRGLDRQLVHAQPQLDALGGRLNKLAGRKDLTFDQKIKLGAADVHRTLAPFEQEIRREVGSLHLGDKLGDAFEAAAPRMADIAGRTAIRAAGAFGNAWLHAGLWGKLFTTALIAKKLGLFTLLGRTAAVRFGTGWSEGTLPMPGAPGRAPGRLGRGGRLTRSASRIGRNLPLVGAALVTGYEVGSELHDTGVGRAGRRLIGTDPQSVRRRGQDRLRAQGRVPVRLGNGVVVWEKPADARRERARTRTPSPRRGSRDIHVTLKVGARDLAKVTKRVNDDDGARR